MVVITVYTYDVKIIKKFRWESGFLGGFHGTPQRKPLYHRNVLIIFTPYVYTLITTIFQEKKYKIFVPFQNGDQITDLHFATFRFRSKFEKTLSQRNFSMKFGSN